LSGGEQRQIEFAAVPSEGRAAEDRCSETILFRPGAGQGELPVTVRFAIFRPALLRDRYLVAPAVIAPAVLLPAVAAQFFAGTLAVRLLLALIAWVMVPFGVAAFRRIWSREETNRTVVLKTAGLLAVLWLVSPLIVLLPAVVLDFLIGLVHVAESRVAVVSILWAGTVGFGWPMCLSWGGLLERQGVKVLAPIFSGALLFGTVSDMVAGYSAAMAMRHVLLLPVSGFGSCAALGLATSYGWARFWAGPPAIAAAKSRDLWVSGLAVCLFLTVLGFGAAFCASRAGVLTDPRHWLEVAKFVFLRVH
jgi:hypothetical protein